MNNKQIKINELLDKAKKIECPNCFGNCVLDTLKEALRFHGLVI